MWVSMHLSVHVSSGRAQFPPSAVSDVTVTQSVRPSQRGGVSVGCVKEVFSSLTLSPFEFLFLSSGPLGALSLTDCNQTLPTITVIKSYTSN